MIAGRHRSKASNFNLGIIGVVWSVFWFWLVTELPRDHPSISDEELEYIESSLGSSVADQKVKPLFLSRLSNKLI